MKDPCGGPCAIDCTRRAKIRTSSAGGQIQGQALARHMNSDALGRQRGSRSTPLRGRRCNALGERSDPQGEVDGLIKALRSRCPKDDGRHSSARHVDEESVVKIGDPPRRWALVEDPWGRRPTIGLLPQQGGAARSRWAKIRTRCGWGADSRLGWWDVGANIFQDGARRCSHRRAAVEPLDRHNEAQNTPSKPRTHEVRVRAPANPFEAEGVLLLGDLRRQEGGDAAHRAHRQKD